MRNPLIEFHSTPSPLALILENTDTQTNRSAALDAMLFTRDPFPIMNVSNYLFGGSDRNTRVLIFVSDLQLASDESVIISLTDANGTTFDLTAENVRPVPNLQQTQVTFRLPTEVASGVCTIHVRAHGQVSNAGTIRISP